MESAAKMPLFALANPFWDSETKLIAAGRELLDRGADVLMLDCLGFHQRHRDLLQKRSMCLCCYQTCW